MVDGSSPAYSSGVSRDFLFFFLLFMELVNSFGLYLFLACALSKNHFIWSKLSRRGSHSVENCEWKVCLQRFFSRGKDEQMMKDVFGQSVLYRPKSAFGKVLGCPGPTS